MKEDGAERVKVWGSGGCGVGKKSSSSIILSLLPPGRLARPLASPWTSSPVPVGAASVVMLCLALGQDGGLGGGDARDGHSEGAARGVVQAQRLHELDLTGPTTRDRGMSELWPVARVLTVWRSRVLLQSLSGVHTCCGRWQASSSGMGGSLTDLGSPPCSPQMPNLMSRLVTRGSRQLSTAVFISRPTPGHDSQSRDKAGISAGGGGPRYAAACSV